MRNCGFKKNKLSHCFSEVKYSRRAKFLCDNLENNCYFQGTRETEADSLLTRVSEGIFTREATVPITQEAAKEVVSEDEEDFEALDNLDVSVSNGCKLKRRSYSLALQNNKKT